MSARRFLEDSPQLVRPKGVADDAIVRVLRVAPEDAGSRVDVFLSHVLRSTSRSRAKLIAERCAFDPHGKPLKPSERLRAEDHVALWRSPVDDEEPDMELPVIHEDPDLLVIDKPPHLTVHPTARHYHATVTRILAGQRPDETLHLIHRLDKETSGVLLLARNSAADRAFKRMFEGLPPLAEPRSRRRSSADPEATRTRAREVEKHYLAICWGHPCPGIIDLPLEPDPDNPLRVKMRVASRSGLSAQTRLEVLDQCTGYSLVRCTLLTGRQHQIRVHLAALGTAVVGDKLYGPDDRMLARAADGQLSKEDLQRLELPRHALHAAQYRLPHALRGMLLDLRAPLSADLYDFWLQVAGRPPQL